MQRTLLTFFLIALLASAGCSTMAPLYTRPVAPIASSWPDSESSLTGMAKPVAQQAANIPWQDFFVDPQLRELITMALKNNHDLRIALLNIERYQAQYQIQRAALLPKVDAKGSGNGQRQPADLSASGRATDIEQYSLGLGISSYELDLFGRVQSLRDQALEQYLATEEARRSVQLSLVANVATTYLTLAANLERLQLARETLVNQLAAYQLIESRNKAGIASLLDLEQARTSVEAARVDISQYTTLVAQNENELRLVVGLPGVAEYLPKALSDTFTGIQNISYGLPSEVLLNRPDILQAEKLLQAANANIGAARAAFFPRITLVSSIGTGSDQLSGLFGSGSLAWNFTPKISLPIFDGGSNKANLKVAEVDRDIAVAQYEQAIQTAFREVADALALRGTIDDQLAAQQALTNATSASYNLSQARYDKGVDSYLNVLDSQRSLYAAQQNLISIRLSRLANQITLYKVLGGGRV